MRIARLLTVVVPAMFVACAVGTQATTGDLDAGGGGVANVLDGATTSRDSGVADRRVFDGFVPPPLEDASTQPDTGGGVVVVDSGVDTGSVVQDSGGSTTGTDCPQNPLYYIAALAEVTAASPKFCASGADCAPTHCCYAALVCVVK